MTVNGWTDAQHALSYLARIDEIPHRTEGEAVMLDLVNPRRCVRPSTVNATATNQRIPSGEHPDALAGDA